MNFSIIIPSNNDLEDLKRLLEGIFCNLKEFEKYEIIIIDSSVKDNLSSIKANFESDALSNLIYFHSSQNLFPGAARNEGISIAKGRYLAFLDTKTIPNKAWFELLKEAISQNIEGYYGKTIYRANSFVQQIILASTFGFNQLKTVPGTIIKKEHLDKIGYFIPNARAGEDSDWILRSHELDAMLINQESAYTSYFTKDELTLSNVFKKWFRNYRSAREYNHIRDHKFIYILFANIGFIFFAFNWNNIFAKWDESSLFYIDNVTKIIVLLSFSCYIFYRSFILPKIKGASFKLILLGGFLPISLLSILIDLTKIAAFISPKIKNNKS